MPDFVHPEKRNSKIAPQREPLAIRTHSHHGAIDLAVTRVDDIPVLVLQSQSLHAADQRETQERRIPAIVRASATSRVGLVTGPGKQLRYGAFVSAIAFYK